MSNVITSKIVAQNQRPEFLSRKIPRYYLHFENYIYEIADRLINGYSGGYWEFVELSNEGFYLKPCLGLDKVEIHIADNGYSGEVSEDAAGIIVTCFSLNFLLYKWQDKSLYHYYESLIAYTYFHEEMREIRAALD